MWLPGGGGGEGGGRGGKEEEEAVAIAGGLREKEMTLEQNFISPVFSSTGLQNLRRQVGLGSSSVYIL